MSNYILIGMPACGKSTVGVILAKTAGKRFIDTDLIIQEQEDALLQDIIDERGNDYFQQAEKRVLMSIEAQNAVISTGGSAVYYPEAMERLGKTGTIIYLSLPLAEIERRMDDIKTRGITMGPGETLKDLYERRVPLYEQFAHMTVDSMGMTVEQTVERIILQTALTYKPDGLF